MTRGVGTVLLSHIINLARQEGKGLHAEYIPNERNRMMLITYKFMKFYEISKRNGKVIFGHDLKDEYSYPDYINVILNGGRLNK
jgi:GNAT superfamily N-acetyltransferase